MHTAVTDPLAGVVLDGRYRVDAVLARGGMSTVYYGTDLRLDRTVAIKVMSQELARDPNFVERFGREARAAAGLAHANVVAVFDQGSDEGHTFIVMELVRGHTLRALLRRRGALDPALALTIIESVLGALAAAHRAGLVHRDIKPENVLLAQDGTVKVADFGLVRAVAQATTTSLTGSVLGTVAYVAPESVTRGTTDPRTDVYSAGILLHELLTGAPPYAGDTAISVAYRHVHDDVPPPSRAVPGLPEKLDALVLHATRREPGARPVDAGAFLAEVRGVRQDLGLAVVPVPLVEDRPDEPQDRTAALPSTRTPAVPQLRLPPDEPDASPPAPAPDPQRRRRRRRTMLASLAVLLLVLAVAGAGWWFGDGRYTRVPDLARLSVRDATRTAQAHHLSLHVLGKRRHSENVPAGAIVSADPAQGSKVPRGTTVDVRLSSGPERFRIPQRLVGADKAAAAAVLHRLPLDVTYSPAYSDSVPAGHVVSFSPEPGTPLRRGQSVTVMISRGPKPFPVPQVTGSSADDAQATLSQAGLTVHSSEAYSDTVPAGQVISQQPDTGDVRRGDAVTLVVSKGPQLVAVPDVQHKPLRAAERALADAGLTPDVRSLFGAALGLVVQVDPGPGTMVPHGSTVHLTVV